MLRNGNYWIFNKSLIILLKAINLLPASAPLWICAREKGIAAHISLLPCPPSFDLCHLDICHLDIFLKNKISERPFNFWKYVTNTHFHVQLFSFLSENDITLIYVPYLIEIGTKKNNLRLIKHKVPQALILALFQFSVPCLWFI